MSAKQDNLNAFYEEEPPVIVKEEPDTEERAITEQEEASLIVGEKSVASSDQIIVTSEGSFNSAEKLPTATDSNTPASRTAVATALESKPKPRGKGRRSDKKSETTTPLRRSNRLASQAQENVSTEIQPRRSQRVIAVAATTTITTAKVTKKVVTSAKPRTRSSGSGTSSSSVAALPLTASSSKKRKVNEDYDQIDEDDQDHVTPKRRATSFENKPVKTPAKLKYSVSDEVKEEPSSQNTASPKPTRRTKRRSSVAKPVTNPPITRSNSRNQ